MINQAVEKNIIVIGGNAAGPAAAAKAKRVNPFANVIMFEAREYISTGTCELPYVLSGLIDDYRKIIYYSTEQFEREKGVKVYLNHFVESINRRKKSISVKNLLSDHTIEFTYDKLIIATGSNARKIEPLQMYLTNVFTLKSVTDLLAIQNNLSLSTSKKVLVIGSGYIGLEVVEALFQLGCKVLLIEKDSLPLPQADEEIRKMILKLLETKGIQFYGNVISPKFRFSDDVLKSIEVEGWNYDVDFAIQAVGFEPNIQLALAAGIEIGKQGIKVDQKLRTSDSNIFAVGDCIELVNQINNRPMYLPLATLARDCGHVAGENAAGGNAVVKPVVPNIPVKIFDKVFSLVGFNSIEAIENKFVTDYVSTTSLNLVKVMPASQETFGKIIFEKGSKRILGAQFFGGNEVTGYSDLLSFMIRNKNKVSDLVEINYNYTPPQSPFINLLSLLGRKAKEI